MAQLSVVRSVALLLTLFTGCTALVYEVTWHFYLANLLGSQARSTSIILATFLGGLAVGYALCGRFSNRASPRTLVVGCGLFEIAIGVWALLFPYLYELVFNLRFVSGAAGGGIFVDLLVAAALIGFPTTLMGATLPFLTQGLAYDVEDAAPFHARIYVLNTLGAFIGALGAGFLLIPTLGLSQTMFWMGIINLIAGTVFTVVGLPLRQTRSADGSKKAIEVEAEASVASVSSAPALGRLTYLALLAFLGGFVSISLQTVLVRVIGLSIGSSTYAFSLVVSAFVLSLALGAHVLTERKDYSLPVVLNQLFIVIGLIGLYNIIPLLPYWSHVWRTLLTTNPATFVLYYIGVFAVFSVLILVPVGALGANLPVLFRESRDRSELLGGRVGLIYAVNTLGCVLGAIFGGYLSLYYLDLDGVLKGCIFGACVALSIASYGQKGYLRPLTIALAAVLAVVGYTATPWPHDVMARGTFRMTKANPATYLGWEAFYERFNRNVEIIAFDDDPNTTVAVVNTGDGSLSIVVNGKSDGSTQGGDRVTTKLVAHLPALLQTSTSRKAAVVGFGTGITVGSLAKYDEFETIDVMEIADAVQNFAPLFDKDNSNASKSPKVQWKIGDAYRFLLESDDKYAVIASEPSNPWVGGVERLYSKEFFDLAKSKLAEGGIYAQWFHTYSVSPSTLELVLNTFRSSFPHAHVFERSADLVIIGSATKIDAKSLEALRSRFGRDVIKKDLTDVGFEIGPKLLGAELWIPWENIAKGPIHTLDKPKLSYWAGKDFFLEAQVEASDYPEQRQHEYASRKSFEDSLIAVDLRLLPYEEMVKLATITYCGVALDDMLSNWRDASFPCRAGLVALTVLGVMPASDSVPQDVIDLFTLVAPSSKTPVRPATSVREARNGLDWIRTYGYPFLRVDPAKVKTFAEKCFETLEDEHAECREKVIRALAANGFKDEAKAELVNLLDSGATTRSDKLLYELKALVGLE